ncbi:MAG: FHA domain-containing protein [Acidobacteriota bacterium]
MRPSNLLALELHDAGAFLGLPTGASEAVGGPGFAWVDGRRIVTGYEAAAQARLQPRRVSSRFWTDLDTQPLPRPLPSGLTSADLAHAHLEAIWREAGDRADRVLLAVPGDWSEAQLGLLLGIAGSLGIPVTALVDAALGSAVAAAEHLGGNRWLHLDVYLHRTVVTELLDDGGVWRRRRVSADPEVSSVSLHEEWARAAARRFVAQTRFDPLHAAATEQRLFAALPDWLAALGTGDVVAELDGRPADLDRDGMLAAVAEPYARVEANLRRVLSADSEPAVILLSATAAALPGLGEQLTSLRGAVVRTLPGGSAAAGVLAAAEALDVVEPGSAAPFITRLPSPPRPAVAAPSPPPPGAGVVRSSAAEADPTDRSSGQPPSKPSPTHVLVGDIAYPVGRRPLTLGRGASAEGEGVDVALGRSADGVSRHHVDLRRDDQGVWAVDRSRLGTFVVRAVGGTEEVQGQTSLRSGDRLRLGIPGVEVLMIRALPVDALAQVDGGNGDDGWGGDDGVSGDDHAPT